jgi:uncharacterized protein YecT (DUF1311 family)
MRNPAGPLAAAVLVAMLAFIPPAAADDVATINACLKTEHDANRSGRDCIGRISDHCLQLPGNESTTSMVQCVDTEADVWDGLLNGDYQRLLGALGDKAADSVRQAERAWIAARDRLPSALRHLRGRLDGAPRFSKLRARPHGGARAAVAHVARDGEAGVGQTPTIEVVAVLARSACTCTMRPYIVCVAMPRGGGWPTGRATPIG